MEYLIFIGCIVAVIIIAKIFSWPLKLIAKLVANIILGAVLLFVINFFGVNFGLIIPINWITALITGLLGIPGAILLIIFQFIF